MMICPDCGQNLDDVPGGSECPSCSGKRRSAVVSAAPGFAAAAGPAPTISIRNPDVRPWTEKWSSTLRCLDALTRVYTGDDRAGNREAESRALDFFVECDHLRDWLKNDTALGLNPADIKAHVQSSTALSVSNAICNSHKHHTRRPGTSTARVREVIASPQGVQITIEDDWATPAATTWDALDLANECVSSWRAFFAAKGIKEP